MSADMAPNKNTKIFFNFNYVTEKINENIESYYE